MNNRLLHANSPYLLQHAHNPVEWYPWGDEALALARGKDRPIFLSIGYAACHWCHVMAHESFEDAETAAFLNQNFVNIKVDREERPDIDSIYMRAVVAMTGQGGWPLSVFLTPDGRPFYGGTYFPPVRRYQMPSFREILEAVHRAWSQDRDKVVLSSQQITDHIQQSQTTDNSDGAIDPEIPKKASLALAQAYDWRFGGWGGAPKFPQPMAIEFMLRRATQGDRLGLDLARHALDKMARGGMYDVVGGGFARYSTDNEWRVPHFEKMLYDNVQLSLVYLHGYLLTRELKYRRICEEILDFLAREMLHPEGGFFSSLDADSEGEEGKFYTWTPAQIQEALSNPDDVDFLLKAYNITEAGNFEGTNVLQRVSDDTTLAHQFGIDEEHVIAHLTQLHAQLLEARQKRVRPMTDDKVLVSWNALAMISFAEAGRYLQRSDYTAMAMRNASFLLSSLYPKDRLMRSWRAGSAQHNGFLEDHATLILALLSLYQSDPDIKWYVAAEQLTGEMIEHFSDPKGGFFDTRDDHGDLLIRPKEIQDNAVPCGNSMAAMALLQLASYAGDGGLYDRADRMLRSVQELASRYPTAFGNWLCAIDFALQPSQEVAILGDPTDQHTQSLDAVLLESFHPYIITARSSLPIPPEAPALLQERTLLEGKSTAYVCRNLVCNLPVNEPQDLRAQLEDR